MGKALHGNPAIKKKIAYKISRKRAQVDDDMVNDLFDKKIEDVTPKMK